MDQDTNTQVVSTGHHRTLGNVIAGLSLLIAALLGGWYLMQKSSMEAVVYNPPVTTGGASTIVTEVDTAAAAMGQQSASDEVADIDADLKATDLGSLNDINQI